MEFYNFMCSDMFPDDELRYISYTHDLEEKCSLSPKKSRNWKIQAWQKTLENPSQSPDRRGYQKKIIDKPIGLIKLKKIEQSRQRYKPRQSIKIIRQCMTSRTKKSLSNALQMNKFHDSSLLEKQWVKTLSQKTNIVQEANYRTDKYCKLGTNDENLPSKHPISCIVYPLIKKSNFQNKHRRIDRFHSFVARTVRK